MEPFLEQTFAEAKAANLLGYVSPCFAYFETCRFFCKTAAAKKSQI